MIVPPLVAQMEWFIRGSSVVNSQFISVVDQDLPAERVVEPLEQLHAAALAAPRRTHQRHLY